MSEPSPFNAIGKIALSVERTEIIAVAHRASATGYRRAREAFSRGSRAEAVSMQIAAGICAAVARRELEALLDGNRWTIV